MKNAIQFIRSYPVAGEGARNAFMQPWVHRLPAPTRGLLKQRHANTVLERHAPSSSSRMRASIRPWSAYLSDSKCPFQGL